MLSRFRRGSRATVDILRMNPFADVGGTARGSRATVDILRMNPFADVGGTGGVNV